MIYIRNTDGKTVFLNPAYISTMLETSMVNADGSDGSKKCTLLYMVEGARPFSFVETEESIENIYQKIQRDLQRPRDEIATRLDRILAEMERQGRRK